MFLTSNVLTAGWNAANLTNLAGLFAADAGGRTAQEWVQIAQHLANRENDVAKFARIPATWNAANLANLAKLFATDAGGRAAQEWAQIAVAHASLSNRENNVAILATAGWSSTALVDFVIQAGVDHRFGHLLIESWACHSEERGISFKAPDSSFLGMTSPRFGRNNDQRQGYFPHGVGINGFMFVVGALAPILANKSFF